MTNTENTYGIVYVLSNPSMPGLYKIGMTRNSSLKPRMRQLYNTSVPEQFRCEFAFRVNNKDIARVEAWVQDTYRDFRYNDGREFFAFDNATRILQWLRDTCSIFQMEDITDTVRAELSQGEIDDEAMEEECAQEKRTRRPNFDFNVMGLPVGSELVYCQDKMVRCVVSGRRHVDFGEKKGVSLSSITRELVGYPVCPTRLWETVNGVNIGDIYDSAYN